MTKKITPLPIPARVTLDFLRSTSAVAELLGIDQSVFKKFDPNFLILFDEEGLWLCPENPDLPPMVSVSWASIGALRDDTIGQGVVWRIVSSVISVIASAPFGDADTRDGVLVVPVSVDGKTAELRLSLLGASYLAERAEKRRPDAARR